MNGNSTLYIASGTLLGLTVGLVVNPLTGLHGTTEVAPWLEVVHRICTSVGGLGTVAALIFVARQFQLLSWQSELLQKNIHASINSALYNRLDSFNRFIVEHHEVYEKLSQPFDGEDSSEMQARLHHLCDLGFTFYEEVFKNHDRYGLVPEEDWDEWQRNLAHFFGKPYVRGYWQKTSPRFSRSFQVFGNRLYETTPDYKESPAS